MAAFPKTCSSNVFFGEWRRAANGCDIKWSMRYSERLLGDDEAGYQLGKLITRFRLPHQPSLPSLLFSAINLCITLSDGRGKVLDKYRNACRHPPQRPIVGGNISFFSLRIDIGHSRHDSTLCHSRCCSGRCHGHTLRTITWQLYVTL